MKKLFTLIALIFITLAASAQTKDKAPLKFDSIASVTKTVMYNREIAVARKSSVYPTAGPDALCDSLRVWICGKMGDAHLEHKADIPSLVGKGGTTTAAYDATVFAKAAAGEKASSAMSVRKIYEDADYVTLEYRHEESDGSGAAPVVTYDAVTFSKTTGRHVGWALVKGLAQDKVLDRIRKGLKDEEGKDGLLAYVADEANDATLRLPKMPPYMTDQGVRITYRSGEYDDALHSCLIRKMADTFKDGGVLYRVTSRKNRKCEVCPQGEDGPRGAISIGEKVSNHGLKFKVEGIDDRAFAECKGLRSVTIGNGVKRIGDEAFSGCPKLEKVTFAGPVDKMGESVFKDCRALSEVQLPESLTRIEAQTFQGCTGLSQIVLPKSLKYIGTEAFGRCSALREIAIPEAVEEIDFLAFESCTALTTVTLLGSETAVNFCAFEECASISTVYDLSATPQDIGSSVFPASAKVFVLPGCKMEFMTDTEWRESNIVEINEVETEGVTYAITSGEDRTCTLTAAGDDVAASLHIPAAVNFRGLSLAVTDVAERAFAGNAAIREVTVPASIASIGREAFAGCPSLQQVVVEGDTTLIGEAAFRGCEVLSAVTLPASVDKLADALFAGCLSLESITLPATLKSVPDSLMAGCVRLADVTLPAGAVNIGHNAFTGCTALTHVALPDQLALIKAEAFKDCAGLTAITLPGGLRIIEERAFAGCALFTSVTLPASVVSIGEEAFADCPLLLSVTNNATVPQDIELNVFTKYGQLHVSPECKKAYKKAKTWRKFRIKTP